MFIVNIYILVYLDVIPQHLAMSLGSTLAQTLASFASSSHSGCTWLAAANEVVDDGGIETPIFYQL